MCTHINIYVYNFHSLSDTPTANNVISFTQAFLNIPLPLSICTNTYSDASESNVRRYSQELLSSLSIGLMLRCVGLQSFPQRTSDPSAASLLSHGSLLCSASGLPCSCPQHLMGPPLAFWILGELSLYGKKGTWIPTSDWSMESCWNSRLVPVPCKFCLQSWKAPSSFFLLLKTPLITEWLSPPSR